MEAKFKTYQSLMGQRVRNILIISSPYDAFIMEEDGGVLEHVFMKFRGISLVAPPNFKVVSNYKDALVAIKESPFDLLITIPGVFKKDTLDFSNLVKEISPHLPIVLLLHGMRALEQNKEKIKEGSIDEIFVWSGNRSIMWTIIKWWEDRLNVIYDTKTAMVRVLILIEDSPHYYSSILQILFRAITRQTQEILEDGLNEEHRLLKLRTRPKILLAHDFEEGLELFKQYKGKLLGIFSDMRYPRKGKIDFRAGIDFLKMVKSEIPELPVLLLSNEPQNAYMADEIPARFQDKNSPSLHQDIRQYLKEHMGFGDFIFRSPDNESEVARAPNINALETVLETVPADSLRFHIQRNHFSNWLFARSEISLALRFRSQKSSDFDDTEDIRKYLINSLKKRRLQRQKGVITSFDPTSYESRTDFAKIGDGSLGGKARGLAFMAKYLNEHSELFEEFKNIKISIPKSLVISTEVYDDFLEINEFSELFLSNYSNEDVAQRFKVASLPEYLTSYLRVFLAQVKYPLAVRSSGLLEDSTDEPYAGLYTTTMIPNNHENLEERLEQLSLAIKLVYASIFYEGPRAFSIATHHRTEEEKMGVLIQEIIGKQYGDYFYPAISGLAQSHNFYPLAFMNPDDGVAHISLGMGKIVVEGGQALRFCPKYPQNLAQFSSVEDILANSQKFFYALKMPKPDEIDYCWTDEETQLARRDIFEAKDEEAVKFLSSSYVHSDNLIRDTYAPNSVPIVTFANILKYSYLPISEIINTFLKIGKEGLGYDLEMEFAVNLNLDQGDVSDFVLLQIRPMTIYRNELKVEISEEDKANAICYSSTAIGMGDKSDIQDIIFVHPDTFGVKNNGQIAQEISSINAKLVKENRKYLLVGPGRWGSNDQCLGIPVRWNDISGVGAIIEASTKTFRADPSQGTHFFQNITSLRIAYMTVYRGDDFINWDWFTKQKTIEKTELISHLQIDHPFDIKINANTNQGVLLI